MIGLTGQTGAGKSTLAQLLRQHGVTVLDADKIAKDVLDNDVIVKGKLLAAFGAEIFDESGQIKRDILAERAFSEKTQTQKLNEITHPAIVKKIAEEIEKLHVSEKIIVIDAPLLFESGLDRLCSCVISIIADEAVRLRRIVKRDGISEALAKKRIAAQNSQDFYTQRSDFAICGHNIKQDGFEQMWRIISGVLEEAYGKSR